MLVLSRKPRQAISIGDDIMIHIKEIRGGSRVVIAVRAPEGMRVSRVDHPEVELSEYDNLGGQAVP